MSCWGEEGHLNVARENMEIYVRAFVCMCVYAIFVGNPYQLCSLEMFPVVSKYSLVYNRPAGYIGIFN